MGTVAIIDRKQAINERYWRFSLIGRQIIFPERTGQIAESFGIRKATLKYNVEPRTFTLTAQCDRCKEVSDVTRTFPSRHWLESFYTCIYRCPSCEVELEQEWAESIVAHNEELRQQYGPLIVRKCPNCSFLTHIDFDPMTVEFYEVCDSSEECNERIKAYFSEEQRQAFLRKMIALLQAKVSNVEPSAPAVTLPS